MTLPLRTAKHYFAAFSLVSTVAVVACGSGDSEKDPFADTQNVDGTGGSAAGGSAPDSGVTAGAAGSGGAGGADTLEQPFDDTWIACTADTDCVVIDRQRTCVACFSISVNATYQQDVIDHYGDRSSCTVTRAAPCPPAPIGAVCTDGRCDFVVDCEVMDKAGMCGEHAKCSVVAGTPCNPGDGGTAPVKVGCFPKPETTTAGKTCAQDPDTGQQLVFLSDEIPPNWTACELSACVCDGQPCTP